MFVAPQTGEAPTLNPMRLMLGSSGVVLVVLLILIAAGTSVWVIWLLKAMQLTSPYQASLEAVRWLDGPIVGTPLLSYAPADLISLRA